MAKFKVGDLVKIKKEVLFRRGEKLTNDTAKIELFYSDVKGGVRLDKDLAGFKSWNVEDLELSDYRPEAANYTRGPLSVRPSARVPWRLETVNESGEVLFERDLPCHSSADKTFEDVMTCRNFPPAFSPKAKQEPDSEFCSAQNKRAYADEVLRAAAPQLLEVLEQGIANEGQDGCLDTEYCRCWRCKARGIIFNIKLKMV